MNATRPAESPAMRAHKHQLAWQILVPFLVAAVLIITAAVVVATSSGSASRPWADVSIIWLIAPTLILALFFIIVLVFLIYGIVKLLQITPHYTGKTRDFFALLSERTRVIADAAAKPIVWFQQAGAILKSIFKL
jgi:hypothetical protein